MDNTCRTCLSSDNKLESIFTITMGGLPLTEVLSLCTGIKVSMYDPIAKSICDNCQNELRICFAYRQKCWDSQAQFMRRLEFIKKNSTHIVEANLNDDQCVEDIDYDLMDDNRQSNDCEELYYNKDDPTMINAEENEDENNAKSISDGTDICITDLYPLHFEYKCRCCRQICKNKEDLRDHLKTFHECRVDIDKGEMQCEICLKIFNKMYFFVTHIKKIHHKSSHILCHFCGVLLIHNTSYQTHVKQHIGEKPFKCELCDYRATQKNSINLHMRSHTGEKPFKCNICDKSYATLSSRSQHKRTHFASTPSMCTICNKSFKRPSLYKSHMRIHYTEKHFKCSFCERTFVRKHRLREHLLRSHDKNRE